MTEAVEGGGVTLMRVVDGSAKEAKGRCALVSGWAKDEDTRNVEKGSGLGDGGRSGPGVGEKALLPIRRGKPDWATVPSADGAAGAAGDFGAD